MVKIHSSNSIEDASSLLCGSNKMIVIHKNGRVSSNCLYTTLNYCPIQAILV
jgi:hypothetical protein